MNSLEHKSNNWTMSPADNSRAPDAKSQRPLAEASRRQSSRYGRHTPSPALVSSISFLRPPPRTMNALPFVPRPFPPPALADVPLEYIIDQLRRLAPHYWSKPETSDCTIVVPLDAVNARLQVNGTDVGSSVLTQEISDSYDPREAARPAPRMIMKLHMDYLSAHSALLRGFLSGASTFDLIDSPPPRPPQHGSDTRRTSAPRSSHDIPMLPSLLPSPPTKPTIYLPVPDPASIRLLVHYVYFGCTSFIEDALDRGELSWEGLARNVEYLGMGREIKVFLGRWYRDWRMGRAPGSEGDESDYGFDSEDECDPWSSDDENSIEVDDEMDSAAEGMSTATSATVFEFDVAYDRALAKGKHADGFDASQEPTRGRKTGQRRLGHATSDPEFSRRTRALDEEVQTSPPAPRGRSK